MPVPFTPKESLQIRFESIEPESGWPVDAAPNVFYTLFFQNGEQKIGSTRVGDSIMSQLTVERVYDCTGSVGVVPHKLGLSCYLAITSVSICPLGGSNLVIPL